MLIEMHPRGVLEQPRGELMLGLLYCLAVDMVDLLADLIIAPALGRAGERVVVAADVERRQRSAERRRIDARGELGHNGGRRRRIDVALIDHHPARIGQHRMPALVLAGRAHIDRAALLVGVLLDADHLGGRGQRVARIHRGEEAELGIAEIGNGVARDVGHGLADDDMEHEQIVDRRARIADLMRERVRRLHGEARAVQRGEQARIADRDRARGRMHDLLAELEVLEIVAGDGLVVNFGVGLVHWCLRLCLGRADHSLRLRVCHPSLEASADADRGNSSR